MKKGQATLDQPLEFDMRPEVTSFRSFSTHPPTPFYELMGFVIFKFSSLQPQLELLLSGNI